MAIQASDISSVLKRRAGFILLLTVLLFTLAASVIYSLPDVYVAHSIVYLEHRRLPKSFDQAGVVVPPLTEAIGPLRQEVLSPEVLRGVIQEVGLYDAKPPTSAGWLTRLRYEDPLARARRDIDVKILTSNEQEYVEISARARAGALASQTVNRISAVLSEKYREQRLRMAGEVGGFLDGELEKARARLQAEESRLQTFRAEHDEALPESQGRITERIRTLVSRTSDEQRSIDEARERLAVLDLELAALRSKARIAAEAALVSPPPPPPPAATPSTVAAPQPPTEVEKLTAEIEALRRKDDDLASRYTSEHPERIALQNKIAGLDARLMAAYDTSRRFPRSTKDASGAIAQKPPSSATTVTATLARSPAERTVTDDKGVIAELVELRATPTALDEAGRILASMASLRRRIDSIGVDRKQDLDEIALLDRGTAGLPQARAELAKLDEARAEALRAHSDLIGEREIVRKFLDAERAMHGDQLRVVEPSETPLSPAEPKRPLLAGIALLAALGLSVGLVYLLELRYHAVLDTTYVRGADIERDLELAVLAVLPAIKRPQEIAGGIVDEAVLPRFPLGEQFQRVRHWVKNHPRLGDARSIMIVSATLGEGKSTISIGLARAFAESLDDRALLVEGDLIRPTLARHLGTRFRQGLSEYLVDGVPLDEIVLTTAMPSLSILGAGERSVAGAPNVVASERMRRFLRDAREQDPDRMLILDAPPVSGTLEALSLALIVDAIIVVVRAGRTPREAVAQAVRELPREKILGVILNGVPPAHHDTRLYSRYYARTT